MKKVRIKGDGTYMGTGVYDAETGSLIAVRALTIRMEDGENATATLEGIPIAEIDLLTCVEPQKAKG